MRPELAGPGAAAPRVEHRHRRLVAEHSWRGLDRPQLKLIEALEPPGGTLHPAGERGAVEMDALAGQNLHLPIQRQIPGELRDHHLAHERRRGHPALDQARQHLCLDHAIRAAAGIFGTDRAQDPQDRGDHVQHLVDVLPDLVQSALAAGAGRRVRLQHLLATRQVLGQRADVAARLLTRLARRLHCRRIVVGGHRRRGAGLEIAQLERELLGDERRRGSAAS